MELSICRRSLAPSLFALTVLIPFGCNGSSGPGSGATTSGPLTILANYQARAPRTCSTVTSPPSTETASILVQCSMDGLAGYHLGLVQDVKLQFGKSRPFVYNTDAELPGIDLTAQVYPLQGSYTAYMCEPINNMSPAGRSCTKSVVPAAQGWCYKTSFGDYKCRMAGNPPKMEQGMPAPQTF
jgi:hypothetical protein